MFVKMSILKRLMKEAYKTGLVLANNGETIMIAGNYWQMEIKRALMPKELLAAIIELAGELPGAGERYICDKGGNQLEFGKPMEINPEGYETEYIVTNVTLLSGTGTEQRILQNYGTGDIELINEVFVDLIYKAEKDLSMPEPAGPYCRPGMCALWDNGLMRFKAYLRHDDENEEMLKELSNVDLTPPHMRKQA